MINKDYSRFTLSMAVQYSGVFIGFLILLIHSAPSTVASYWQERKLPRADLALEVILPNDSQPPIRLVVYDGERSMALIPRHRLTIIDRDAAKDFTAVDIWADTEGKAINVRLSIIYNDLSNQEWWKAKKEKILGSFRVPENESVRPSELAQYGLAPFEMKVVSAKPIVFQPGDGLRIINDTTALEVARLEKSLDRYQLWLKNNSSKNVVAYYLSVGESRLIVHGRGYANRGTLIAAGETYPEEHLQVKNVESSMIVIRVVVFDDGTFEGDSELAAGFLAKSAGIGIQAPYVLRMIGQTLESDDAELETAFNKLETELGLISEGIDKQKALELLKSKYPHFDVKTLSILYEDLKAGLYEAKNMGLMPIGNIKRRIQELEQDPTVNKTGLKVKLLRETLIQIKGKLEALSKTR